MRKIKALALMTALAAAIITITLLPATTGAQDGDKDGDSAERFAPTQPRSLQLNEVITGSGQLQAEFAPGFGATIHEFQLLRSETEAGAFTAQGKPVTADTSPVDLGTHDLGYWYRVKARGCNDDDVCSSYLESAALHVTEPPLPTVAAVTAASDPASSTLTLGWTIAETHPSPEDYSFEITVADSDAFTEAGTRYQVSVPGTASPLETVIARAWTVLGAGKQRWARIRACDTDGQCAGGTIISIRLTNYLRELTGPGFGAGSESAAFTIPHREDDVFVDIQTAGTPVDGHVQVQAVTHGGHVVRSQQADRASDSGVLPWPDYLDTIRVAAGENAFASVADTVTINFHWGTSTQGVIIATASVERQTRPAAPVAASPAHTEDSTTGAITLDWTEGTHPAGSGPDHYEVEVSTTGARLETVHRNEAVSGTSLTIPRNLLDEDQHQAEIRHCNSQGGCSEALTTTFTPTPDTSPRVRISGLARELPRHFRQEEFSVTADRLEAGTEYSITVSVPTGSRIGFGERCEDLQERFTIPSGRTSHSINTTLSGCLGMTGTTTTTTADLRQTGTATAIDTHTQALEIKSARLHYEGPSGHDTEIGAEGFTFLATGMLSTQEYSIMIFSDTPNIGLGIPCAENPRQYFQVTPGMTEQTFNATMHRCQADPGGLQISLFEAAIDPANPVLPIRAVILETLRTRIGTRLSTELLYENNELEEGRFYPFGVLASGMQSASNGNAGFDQSCTQTLTNTFTGMRSLREYLQIHACQDGNVTLTTLLSDDHGTRKLIETRLTVTPRPASLELQDLPAEIENGGSAAFTVEASNLTAGTNYELKV